MSVIDRAGPDNRCLFITGGSRGLGSEMALVIAAAGADVVLVGRDADSLARTSADIRAALSLGAVGILIDNIGGRRISVPIEEEPMAEWQRMMDLKLTGTFLCTKLIGAAMLACGAGGRVTNIALVKGVAAAVAPVPTLA